MDKLRKVRSVFATYLLAIFLAKTSFCQVQTARFITIDSNCHGYYEILPTDYGTSGINYPMLLFLHGAGELGNGTTDLPKVQTWGPPRLAKIGKWPATFTTPQGKTYSFIVIAPQFAHWPTVADVEAVYHFAITHYRVNVNMVSITGLSMGGGVTLDYVAANSANASKIAAIAPMAPTTLLSKSGAATIAIANVAAWLFHNEFDNLISDSVSIKDVQEINSNKPPPKPLAKLTIFPDSGHDAWFIPYMPTWKDSGYSVYEWMLQFQRNLAVLPITLTSFNAVPQRDNTIKLDWSTDTNANSGYFQVERSQDGTNFASIEKMDASGNSSLINYDYVDHQPYTGISYYRLAMVDQNGSVTYSDTRKVLLLNNTKSEVSVSPNPVYNNATLVINSDELGDINGTLFDMTGRLIQNYRFKKDQPYFVQIIPMYNVPKGDYVLLVRGKTINETVRISKQ